ncbi:hypothetical protein SNOG_06284 [Parastagonospora nodorum SN15]|uniref:Uncharacterized protein n=1 Tax=Phaeosphaeria nodorum (strain SN15 / ATCC MYA-4574 / FGSC 10173) TaxID=321614 RepID=Q0UPN0_PHANO|nr:hypothetical protein SNOG_06284 [Parastagonospora nodorum SN15]EAT86115.1 hypothetical protein SNOG_06284 [Parastagonospora nodorum SN15]
MCADGHACGQRAAASTGAPKPPQIVQEVGRTWQLATTRYALSLCRHRLWAVVAGARSPVDKCQALLHEARAHFALDSSLPRNAFLHAVQTLRTANRIAHRGLQGHTLYLTRLLGTPKTSDQETKWSKRFNLTILYPPLSLPPKIACEHATSLQLPLYGGESL